jgi:Fe-S-cluster containining protein
MTRFYHHTYIEYLYLYHAFERLDDELRHHIRQKACEVRTQTMATKECKNPQRLMCPLNFEERCRLYAWRPMICRLHGIAYELNFPSRGLMRGAGCHEFEKTVDQTPYKPFDRTPFYNKMASLEHDFKQALGLNRKIKKTIAEMLADELSLL